jgi:hypothetical protein
MNGAVYHCNYMASLCGQGNFSSMIIVNINGDECPVDPDDINGRGEHKTLCYLKNIYLITNKIVTNILIILELVTSVI